MFPLPILPSRRKRHSCLLQTWSPVRQHPNIRLAVLLELNADRTLQTSPCEARDVPCASGISTLQRLFLFRSATFVRAREGEPTRLKALAINEMELCGSIPRKQPLLALSPFGSTSKPH